MNLPCRVEYLHAAVGPVADVDIAIGVDGDVGGAVELAVARPEGAEGHHAVPVGIELLHTVVLVVGHVDGAVGIGRDAPG